MINFVLALAIALLGFLVGWLTGASGSNEASGLHPQVVAAVVPVVITASGLVLYYAALKFPEKIIKDGSQLWTDNILHHYLIRRIWFDLFSALCCRTRYKVRTDIKTFDIGRLFETGEKRK